jgi:UDP-N-acetylglucosamine acyltransferase
VRVLTLIKGEGNELSTQIVYACPQDKKWYSTDSQKLGKIIIGNRNIIREFVAIHYSIQDRTEIGNNNFIMCHSHIAHDCILGDRITIASGVQLGGYTHIHDYAYLGFNVCTHPYTVIGECAIIGMGNQVVKDVPPYAKFYRGCIKGINRIGMERANYTESEIKYVEDNYTEMLENLLFSPTIKSMRVKMAFNRFFQESKRHKAKWDYGNTKGMH